MGEASQSQKPPLGQRLRRAALFALFSTVLLIPKTLALRRRHRLWMNLRFGTAVVGAALVIASQGEWGWLSGAGIALLLLALAARPARAEKTADEQARELDALVALNGGRFELADGQAVETRLFVGSDRIHALDLRHRPLLEVPLEAVSRVRVEEAPDGWQLSVDWNGERARFRYQGYFAEHLARVAETTINRQRRAELPVVK